MQDWNLVISRAMLLRLATLVRRHECRIVLSTSWRVEPGAVAALAASFAAVGLGESVIIGSTPERRSRPRATEIEQWLTAQAQPCERWIAIDDIDLAKDAPSLMEGRFVHTAIGEGLSDARAAYADGLLSALGAGMRRIAPECRFPEDLPSVNWARHCNDHHKGEDGDAGDKDDDAGE